MAMKKRQKVLTPAEIKEKLKKELTPFWINSEVLFNAQLYPVHEKFTKQISIILLLDAADYGTEIILKTIQKWEEKYEKLPWFWVIVFQQKYLFLKNQKFFDQYKNNVIFVDAFGELFERFGSSKEPVAVILKNGELISSLPLMPQLSEQAQKIETELQKLLRVDDPGLPLPKIDTQYAKINESSETFGIDKISTIGEWNGNKTMLYSEENNSTISFSMKGRKLRVVGLTNPDGREFVKVSVTLNDKPIPFPIRTDELHEDSKGLTIFELNKTKGIYDILISEAPIIGTIKLKFLNVFDNGVLFYEIRVSD